MDEIRRFAHAAATAYLSLFFDGRAGYAERELLVRALRPRAEDFAVAFAPAAAEVGRRAYPTVWRETPVFGPSEEQSRLHVGTFVSDDLRHAPPAWRPLAPALKRGRIWVSWAFAEPAGRGTTFDGMLFLGDRFAWFPRPWRFLQRPAPGPVVEVGAPFAT